MSARLHRSKRNWLRGALGTGFILCLACLIWKADRVLSSMRRARIMDFLHPDVVSRHDCRMQVLELACLAVLLVCLGSSWWRLARKNQADPAAPGPHHH